MSFRWIIAILFILNGFTVTVQAATKEPPMGILILKPSPSAPDTKVGSIIEYQVVTEHLVPATDYVSITRTNGERDDIEKNLILRRVDYPRKTDPTILTPDALHDLETVVKELQAIVARYPDAHRYLDPKITDLQQEIDLFSAGNRKINGSWISGRDYEKLLETERERVRAVEEAKKQAVLEAARKKSELAAEEAKRKRDAAEAARVAEEKHKAELAALEAKHKAEEILKKKKAAALLAQNTPPPSVFTYIPWKTMVGMVILGSGIFVWVRRLKARAGPRHFTELDWPKFELLIAEIYRRSGYAVEISSGFGSETGVDLKLTRQGETTLVYSKYWKTLNDYKISAGEVGEFARILAEQGAQSGIFISTGEFSSDALELAASLSITLVGKEKLELLIAQVKRKNENLFNVASWIGDFASHAKIADPQCPLCSKPMLLVVARDGTPSWQCSDQPACLGKLDARIDLMKYRRSAVS